jgi:hypothetical protein
LLRNDNHFTAASMETTMPTNRAHTVRLFPALLAAAALSAGCDTVNPLDSTPAPDAALFSAQENQAIATLRQATARYHDVNNAIDDEFILLHGCEVRPGEGAVGTLYIHLGRYLDGVIDPAAPDALLYAPGPNGKLMLAGVEFALPTAMSPSGPPSFLGVPFQTEDEFAAYALHIWVWRHNANGMFAPAHPDIACPEES